MTREHSIQLLRNGMKLVILDTRCWVVETTAPSTRHGGFCPELLEDLREVCEPHPEESCLVPAGFNAWDKGEVWRFKKEQP